MGSNPPPSSYDDWRAGFAWDLPERLNMAAEAGRDWALRDGDGLAVIDLTGTQRWDVSRAELWQMAARLAEALAEAGVARGDRVGVLRSQSAWTAAAHLAIWAMGAVSVPLFTLFGEQALALRMTDSGARALITDPTFADQLAGAGATWNQGCAVVVPEALPPRTPSELHPVDTGPEDPAVLIYTSGTTGPPKGALHGHRMLRGHLPAVQMAYDLIPQPGDILWTPADWAWIGGLFDLAMPGLQLGVPIVAARLPKFTAPACADLVARSGANCLFMPPTALRRLKAEGQGLSGLRAVCSGGEPLGAELLDWGRDALGVTINELYGQTECNLILGSCGALFPPLPGALGKPTPGAEVRILNAGPTGEGDIAVRRGAAQMMLGYWGKPEATAAKFQGDWMLTGDRGSAEGDFIRFLGREDDVITSAGYRIGPGEVEDCLIRHPAVASAGVVGKPDRERTQIVCAFITLREGAVETAALKADLQSHVKTQLAAYEYPREIHVVESLPQTVTGKTRRRDLRRWLTEGLPA